MNYQQILDADPIYQAMVAAGTADTASIALALRRYATRPRDTDDTDDTDDRNTAKECYDTEVLPSVYDETYDGPSLCVLSTGYAEVWSDGDVTQNGIVLFNVADD